jgi:hypothetical protein
VATVTRLALALASLLVALPPHPSDRAEPASERRARLEHAAQAIAEVSAGNRGLAAALVVVAEDANAFARYVGEGRCKDGQPGARCSGGHARGYFDLTQEACPELFERPEAATENLAIGSRCAARALLAGFRRCGRARDWTAAFKLYAVGSCQQWPGQARRAGKWRWMSARLRTSPSAKAIRDSIEQLCERDGCSTEVEAGAITDLYSEPPGGFGGLTADQAAESLIEGQRRPYD